MAGRLVCWLCTQWPAVPFMFASRVIDPLIRYGNGKPKSSVQEGKVLIYHFIKIKLSLLFILIKLSLSLYIYILSLYLYSTHPQKLPALITNQLDHFISTLPSSASFRRLLLSLKNTQDSELFQLEQEYLALVRDRRTSLLNYLRTTNGSTAAGGKRNILEGLKELHGRTQAEFDAFIKVKVYYGWQMGQLSKHIEVLKEAGLPGALLSNGGIGYYQSVMEYLLKATI